MEEFNLNEEVEEKKHYFIIILFIVLFLGCSIVFYQIKKKMQKPEEKEEIVALEKEEEKIDPINYFKVDIKGAIKKPGVYEVVEGSRVTDVITIAGGLRKDANTSLINLSKKVVDEMTIIIYTNEDIDEFRLTKKISEYQEMDDYTTCPDATNQACIKEEVSESTKTTTEKVSLNHATKEQLLTLTGIGESKADAILAYRNENSFETIEDIKNVSGIGESVFEKIKDHITL